MTNSRTLVGVGASNNFVERGTLYTGGTRQPGNNNLAGTTLAGRYDLLEMLGAGGMGTVYRARDRELDEVVALKVIRGDLARHDALVEQFRHEVKLARRVTHVNIARTFELGIEGELIFCTMELVEGESLRVRLEREGALQVSTAAAIAVALCEGLAVAHAAGVIHRDIKPDNVLLTPRGRVVLADFGVAAFSTAESDGALVGTLEYMAPEQARGEHATPATDVYALGVVLFEMLCGMRAFAGTMSELVVAKQDVEKLTLDFAESVAREPLPLELKALVERATERDPSKRISTAAELGRRLAPFLAAEVSDTNPHLDLADHFDEPNVVSHDELATVIVLAPRAADPQTPLHVASGIHQELLRRLASRRLRVWPRVDAFDMPGATFVELLAGHHLRVTIRRDALGTSLELPLEIEHVGLVADAIAIAASDLATSAPDPDATERLELLLRAREHRGSSRISAALKLLQSGYTRWPDDPRIACDLADLILRHVLAETSPLSFDEIRELVEAALVRMPQLAEAHIAAGQLALHTGDPVVAAREYRTAIACSPYQAEPHEGLGRMLLEAGFIDDAMPRLENALAIAPNLASVRWEIARARALERNWHAHDRIVAEVSQYRDRPISRLRFSMWRGDRARLAETFDVIERVVIASWERELFRGLFSVVRHDTWNRDREAVVKWCLETTSPSKRRLALLAQLGAEVSGYFGDVDVCLTFLRRAVDLDLFDYHWFSLCPLLGAARASADGQRLQQVVRLRAESILDAFYGDS